MSLFIYKALSAEGRTLTGTLQASSEGVLAARLKDAGVWLLEARETTGGTTVAAGTKSRLRARRGELITFFLQMSLLLKAGVTLPQALERLAKDLDATRLGPAVKALHDQVVIGVSLHTAMDHFPRIFPRHVTAMIEAGEASGQMPEIFGSLTHYFEWLDQLVSDIRQAVIYPLMVSTAALGLVLLLFTFVVPRFVGLLLDLNLEVPLLTKIVMGMSEALLRGWPALLALGVALPVALKLALRVPAFARAFDGFLLQLPVVGGLVSMFALSRFAHNLALLYRAGVPLLRGLEITRELVGNHAIAHALDDVRRSLAEGTPLHKGLAAHAVFPPTIVTMVATGESSGSLDVALQSVADYFNKLAPRRIKLVFAIFDPLAMFALIGVVAVVAAAVILPILQLWQAR